MTRCECRGESLCGGSCRKGYPRDLKASLSYEQGRKAGLEEAAQELETMPVPDWIKGAAVLAIRLRKGTP